MLATPTAAGMALKAWDGRRGGDAAMGPPSWSGMDTPRPVVHPSSQAFAAAASRLVVCVRQPRFWNDAALPRLGGHAVQLSFARAACAPRARYPTFGISSKPIFPSRRHPTPANHVRGRATGSG